MTQRDTMKHEEQRESRRADGMYAGVIAEARRAFQKEEAESLGSNCWRGQACGLNPSVDGASTVVERRRQMSLIVGEAHKQNRFWEVQKRAS